MKLNRNILRHLLPKWKHFIFKRWKCYLFRVLARYFVPFLLARDGYFFWRKAYSSRIESVTLFLLLISSWLLWLKNSKLVQPKPVLFFSARAECVSTRCCSLTSNKATLYNMPHTLVYWHLSQWAYQGGQKVKIGTVWLKLSSISFVVTINLCTKAVSFSKL